MNIPDNLRYTADHEWLLTEDDTARVGITAYAADALGDVVFVELPKVGATLRAGHVCGELESTKSVSDLFAPADGKVLEVNHSLGGDPEAINSDPYGDGWLFTMRLTGSPDLLDAATYAQLTVA